MKKFIVAFALVVITSVGLAEAQSLQVQASSYGGTLPNNGVRIPLLTLTLRASNEPVNVKSLALTRAGLSSSDDVGRLWIQKDYRRLSRARQFGNDDTMTLDFTRDFTVAANSTETIQVLGNLNFEGSGRTLRIQLDNVVSDATDTIPLKKNLSYQQSQPSPGVFTHSRARYDKSQYRIKCENRKCRLVRR